MMLTTLAYHTQFFLSLQNNYFWWKFDNTIKCLFSTNVFEIVMSCFQLLREQVVQNFVDFTCKRFKNNHKYYQIQMHI